MKFVSYPIATVFDAPDAGAAQIAGFEPAHPHQELVPEIDPDYLFRTDCLSDICAWWGLLLNGQSTDGLFLSGDPAAGKTSLVLQFFARLNVPVIQLTGDEDRDIPELISARQIVAGDTITTDGVITEAMRLGAVLLINEVSYFRPQTVVALNDLIEQRRVTIPETGEVVSAQGSFGLVVTDNTNGGMDEFGRFVGTKAQNEAFLDRFLHVQVPTMSKADEVKLLARCFPNQDESLFDQMVEVAHQVRRAVAEGQISQALSLRSLKRWASWLELKSRRYGSQAVFAALDRAFTYRLGASQRQAVYDMVQTVFGVARSESPP